MRLFLCGDVMVGRGIDQVMPTPCDPAIHEGWLTSALDYVRLAERANGSIPAPVDLSYVWGAALQEWDEMNPDLRIVNLETSITRSADALPKGINYRVSPENARCLAAAKIDCCTLANNHVLDWGVRGLDETLAVLDRLGIAHAGAGRNATEACRPAILDRGGAGRVVVHAVALGSGGVPPDWKATSRRPGVDRLADLSQDTAAALADRIARTRRAGDLIVVSVHWGPNWGYRIGDEQRRFAHALIDRAGVSIVHGHSSHHAQAIEIHRDRLILHGCGDFLNDYEGIRGYEEFRGDLAIMYFATLEPVTGRLAALDMVPLQVRNFRLRHASAADVAWLQARLDRESRPFGTAIAVDRQAGRRLTVAI